VNEPADEITSARHAHIAALREFADKLIECRENIERARPSDVWEAGMLSRHYPAWATTIRTQADVLELMLDTEVAEADDLQ